MKDKSKEKKINVSRIISGIVLFILAFASFTFGLHIHDKGSGITNFCNAHYKDSKFIDLFYDYEPYVLKTCWDRDKKNYNPETCSEITEEQLRFIQDCGWMDKDYFVLVGTLIFGFFLPAVFLIIAGAELGQEDRSDKYLY